MVALMPEDEAALSAHLRDCFPDMSFYDAREARLAKGRKFTSLRQCKSGVVYLQYAQPNGASRDSRVRIQILRSAHETGFSNRGIRLELLTLGMFQWGANAPTAKEKAFVTKVLRVLDGFTIDDLVGVDPDSLKITISKLPAWRAGPETVRWLEQEGNRFLLHGTQVFLPAGVRDSRLSKMSRATSAKQRPQKRKSSL
jgi:hypothetical protein